MSVQDVLLGPDCGLDIYEEPDENKWVECSMRKSKIGVMIAAPILVVIAICCIFFGGTHVKVFGAIFCAILIGGLVLSHLYWTPVAARNEHKRFQRELKSYIDRGMSPADAVREIKQERLQREMIAAQTRAAQSTARTNATGMFAIANALKH